MSRTNVFKETFVFSDASPRVGPKALQIEKHLLMKVSFSLSAFVHDL